MKKTIDSPELNQDAALPEIALPMFIQDSLGSEPPLDIPAGFAVRVARAAQQEGAARRTRHSWGVRSYLGSLALILFALFLLAPSARATFSSLAYDGELLLLAELCGLFLLLPRFLLGSTE